MTTKDITGNCYGTLTVIGPGKRPDHAKKSAYWLCSCNCLSPHCRGQVSVPKGRLVHEPNITCGGAGSWIRSKEYKLLLATSLTKVCSTCGKEKPKSDFYKYCRSPDGRSVKCKECSSTYGAKIYLSKRDELLNKQRKYYKQNKEAVLSYAKTYREENKDIVNAKDKKYRDSPDTTVNHVTRLLPEDKAEMINGVITVVCKLCGKRYTPIRRVVLNRVQAIEGKRSGEHHFYCSDSCKKACPLHGFKPHQSVDPRSKLYVPPSEAEADRKCQTDHLKQLQCDERGYNWCEKCGDIIDVELHHTQAVGSKDAVSSAGHMLLCAGCHVELHGDCRL